VEFDITLAAMTGAKHPSDAAEYLVFRTAVAQTAWIGQLKAAGASNNLVLELSTPFAGGSQRGRAVVGHIVHARKLFDAGLYSEAVGECGVW